MSFFYTHPLGFDNHIVTNNSDVTQRDIYYLYNDYQGSLIAAKKKGSKTLEQFSGVYPVC